jgi:hypothetical protein
MAAMKPKNKCLAHPLKKQALAYRDRGIASEFQKRAMPSDDLSAFAEISRKFPLFLSIAQAGCPDEFHGTVYYYMNLTTGPFFAGGSG